MATVKVYDQNKQESGEITLASDVFEIEVRPEILNLVARAQMAAKRAGTHMLRPVRWFPAAVLSPGSRRALAVHALAPTVRPFGAVVPSSSDPARVITASRLTARCALWP